MSTGPIAIESPLRANLGAFDFLRFGIEQASQGPVEARVSDREGIASGGLLQELAQSRTVGQTSG